MRKTFLLKKYVSILSFFLLSSCNFFIEPSNIDVEPTILIPTGIYNKESAFHAYFVADEFAKNWNENAEMTQIIIGSVMAKNIGIPPSKEAWYFMYNTNENSIELYIEVIDGKVTGYTEAQPIITDELRIQQKPIIIDGLIDSDVVMEIFSMNNSLDSKPPNSHFELALHYLEGYSNPVWSVFELSNEYSSMALVFRVDAKTQEILPIPNNSEF